MTKQSVDGTDGEDIIGYEESGQDVNSYCYCSEEVEEDEDHRMCRLWLADVSGYTYTYFWQGRTCRIIPASPDAG